MHRLPPQSTLFPYTTLFRSKKISKTQAVTSQIPHEMERAAVHIGPSDHVPWLDDRKMAYVRLEGRAFGDVPLSLEYKLDRKSTRLNSSHPSISYAVFCLKKK